MVKRRIAFTATGGGLMEQLTSHFGHTQGFTAIVFDDETKNIEEVEVIKNIPHEQGGCMQPVMLLKNAGVTDIVVGGIGQRPLLGFIQVGINPYFGIQGTVKENFEQFLAGKLQKLADGTCRH
ncbi:MAG: NifB/NifX family molybdenum-iron cluster-binding protein [Promethearchaeota archaeon]